MQESLGHQNCNVGTLLFKVYKGSWKQRREVCHSLINFLSSRGVLKWFPSKDFFSFPWYRASSFPKHKIDIRHQRANGNCLRFIQAYKYFSQHQKHLMAAHVNLSGVWDLLKVSSVDWNPHKMGITRSCRCFVISCSWNNLFLNCFQTSKQDLSGFFLPEQMVGADIWCSCITPRESSWELYIQWRKDFSCVFRR